MKGMIAALWTECIKVKHSKIFLVTILVFAFISFMLGILVFLAKHPNVVSNSPIISIKAAMIGNADWHAYFLLLHQVIAMVGLIGFGFVVSWIFGREYSDRTVTDLLALPVPRSTIVISKFIIFIIWCIILSLVCFIVGLATGLAVRIEGWSGEMALHASRIFTGTAFLTILLCTPVAFVASSGRGYLLPIGFLVLIMILTQLIAVGIPGISPYFPWAVPALYCGAAGPMSPHIGAISYIILVATSILGVAGTIVWWRFADQT